MSLRDAPLLYLFYETASLERQRALCEAVLGLPVIENQFHPPHEYHGLVKYDAGQLILSLNLAKEPKFLKGESDGMILVMTVADEEALHQQLRAQGYAVPQSGEIFTDDYGHHYPFRATIDGEAYPVVQEIRFLVNDLAAAADFYGDILGLTLREERADSLCFATGPIDLVIQEATRAPDGRPLHYHTYLPVFYTEDIVAARDALVARGLQLRSARIGQSDIGHTVRFNDPAGQIFCLYQPSAESLSWDSGPKVREITQGRLRVT